MTNTALLNTTMLNGRLLSTAKETAGHNSAKMSIAILSKTTFKADVLKHCDATSGKTTTVVLKTAKLYTAVLNTVTININMLDTAFLDNNMTAIKSTAIIVR